MDAPATRSFTSARIAALALIALAVLGLAYLRAASGSGSVSVPKGARAGQLMLHSCSYGTERGSYAADCGTLVVPENRHDPHSRLIALPVKRIRALIAHPGEPVFRLQGGPGLTNMDFPDASRYAGDRDVVLVGYRGVDGSSVLDCPEVVSAMKHARDLIGPAYFGSAERAFAACAHRLREDGVDLAGYSLPERVDDLEAARRALGYRRIDLLSESAGTRTALIYAWRHPRSIHRSVMVGVNPPGNFVWNPRTTDEQIRKYSALCARQESCSSRTSDLAATFAATSRDLPSRWGFLRIEPGDARLATFFGLFHSTPEASPISAPMTIDSWLAAAHGDASGLWLLSTLSRLVFPDIQVKGDVAAVARTDARYARRFFASGDRKHSLLAGSPGSDFLWAGGRLLDGWPANPDENEYGRVQDSKVDSLLIGGNLDFATPPQTAARELLPHLPNGRQVVLPGLGHTDDFWSYEPEASSRLINAYLARGRVDTSLYTPNHVDLKPGFSQTRIAKIVLATLLGFAGLTVLSLLALALRVRSRGGLGGKSGFVIRSLYVLVLGVGGWFLGVLVALTWLPTVPLDSAVLAGLSIGLPVGLGVYLAWYRSELEARARAIGLAGSLAAGLVGAWLGLQAVAGLYGVVTAAIGATAAANLTLLGLDISWDHGRGIPAPERSVLLQEEAGDRRFGRPRLRPRADDPASTQS
jgi:pimeloyl-ACP methyl ester carboxylesterase